MSHTDITEENIRALKEECSYLASTKNAGAPKVFSKLLRIAGDTGDFGLLGFVYFHRANYHYISGAYDAFYRDLGLAIRALLRSDEHELLARSFNLFANEAYSKGALDVAYNYYMTAFQFLENKSDSPFKGGLLINLAGLFTLMEYYKEARRYFKKGIVLLKKHRDDFYYQRNLVVAYIIDGLNSIAMGDITAAEKSLRATKRIYGRADASLVQETRLIGAIFEARLALAMQEDQTVRIQAHTIAGLLMAEEAIYESMDDIRDFCHTLIDAGYLKEAGLIIDMAATRMDGSDVTRIQLRLMEMKVDYYEKTHDEKNLMKCLTEQNRLFMRSLEEQQELYRYSIEYIQLIDDLKIEEEQIRRGNEMLQARAERDELCGIPNRYAMDREIERAYECAYNTQTPLGICLLDVNRFKEINDTYGHQAGDLYLTMIGSELKKCTKDERIFCARYGGDEFLMIYKGMSNEEILKKALALRRAISNRKITLKDGTKVREISVSLGICNGVPDQETRSWDYLTAADAALYDIKRASGSNDGVCLRNLAGKDR